MGIYMERSRKNFGSGLTGFLLRKRIGKSYADPPLQPYFRPDYRASRAAKFHGVPGVERWVGSFACVAR